MGGSFFAFRCMYVLFVFFCRHLAIAGRTGHVSTFDWQTGTVHAELQLQETCRDITYAPSLPRVFLLKLFFFKVPT